MHLRTNKNGGITHKKGRIQRCRQGAFLNLETCHVETTEFKLLYLLVHEYLSRPSGQLKNGRGYYSGEASEYYR